MGRQPCCDKSGLKRGPWTLEEDQKLINFILNNGIHCWRLVPKLAGLMRCGKSCRLRWTNYLRPDLKRGAISEEEENQIIQLHSRFGNRHPLDSQYLSCNLFEWSKIASYFPGRTDNEIKNHWNTRIKKRFKLLGLDPATHKIVNQPENFNHQEVNFASQASTSQVKEIKSTDASPAEMACVNQSEAGLSIWMSCESKAQVDSLGNGSSSLKEEDSELCNPSSVESILGMGDSFPSWEAMYPLEDLLFFGNLL
ncbi:hypothetical protein Cni_G21556 [Canna indica]|uniref:Uncharacterized protein n=1 Tax=Canna indica TaxID=4628 RepID=A0AAQ3KTC8_9LILI|nr:hypothetical protein Cni_G21556 [Canna indica]